MTSNGQLDFNNCIMMLYNKIYSMPISFRRYFRYNFPMDVMLNSKKL